MSIDLEELDFRKTALGELSLRRRRVLSLEGREVFALWSNDPPDPEFQQTPAATFAASRAHVVTFRNPLLNRDAANTVYVARI